MGLEVFGFLTPLLRIPDHVSRGTGTSLPVLDVLWRLLFATSRIIEWGASLSLRMSLGFPLVLTAGHYLNASLLKNGPRSLASL